MRAAILGAGIAGLNLARRLAQGVLDAIWHEDDGIGLCGDWLRGDRVEDGYLSGEALAARVLASSGRR